MTLRVRRGREAEDGGCGDGNADAVRDYGVGVRVAWVVVGLILAADGVAHAVAKVHAGVTEADARQRRGEEHF